MSTKPKQVRQKPISLAQIKKQQKEINTMSTYVLDSETNTVLKYYEKFDNLLIEELLTELHENVLFADKHNIDFFNDESIFLKYVYFLLIKKFTHLGKDIPDTLPEQIPVISTLISTGLFETIFEHCFDPEEVARVIEKFQQFTILAEQLISLNQFAKQELEEKVDNKEIFQAFNSNKQPIHPLVNPTVAD